MANYTDRSFIHTTDYIIMEKYRTGEWIPEPSTGQIYSRQTKALLRPFLDNGYLRVKTTHKGRRVNISIARAIWVMIQGIPLDPALEIDHINRIKTDNRLENLRLVSSSENKRNTAAAAVTLRTAEEIRRIFAAGEITQKEMAHRYNCSPATIRRIIRCETHRPENYQTAAAGGN